MIKKIMCSLFGHDPKLMMAMWKDGKYIVTYVCDCGKRMEVDETIMNLPYPIILGRFNKRGK